jgi:dipeptidyl aminopeptidase/acylaminoacyl peptidase
MPDRTAADAASARHLPYGSWPSPVAASDLVTGAAQPTDVWAADGAVWWSQTRPDEGGRIQVVRRDADGTVHDDVLPPDFNARTGVHEMGGGAWWVHDGAVFAVSWADQRLYRTEWGSRTPVPLTPEPEVPRGLRYADGRVTPDGRTVICVRESHPAEGGAESVRNEIVALPAVPGGGITEPSVLVSGYDFVSSPRISPDGRKLAWIAWQCPNMPWDATVLWVADIEPLEDDGGAQCRLVRPCPVASGRGESLVQPEWGPDGELYVVSDRSNWWNVYRITGLERLRPKMSPVHQVEAEVALPPWLLGQSRYVVTPDGTVWYTYSAPDGAHLVRVTKDGTPTDVGLPFLRLEAVRLDGTTIRGIASYDAQEAAVVSLALDAPGARKPPVTVLRKPREVGIDPASISRPQRVSFPSARGRTAYGWLYLPRNAKVSGPPDELPPLLVTIHGGPTGAADPSFRLSTQYWTTRGFAVVDVDYGGSTGLGRGYRRLLDGAWGVVDVEDACAAAMWLADEDLVDGGRLLIRGGSAGGFTVLTALATREVFAAGASHFGIADLAALARDTHKFEARYLDRLVGPLPAAAAVYAERSPLTHVDGFDRPLIVLQGGEDRIVPPAQAELIVNALAAKGVPHAYLLFPDEQHGFRRAENIVRALEAELSFYGQVFGFEPAGGIEPVAIEFGDQLPLTTTAPPEP